MSISEYTGLLSGYNSGARHWCLRVTIYVSTYLALVLICQFGSRMWKKKIYRASSISMNGNGNIWYKLRCFGTKSYWLGVLLMRQVHNLCNLFWYHHGRYHAYAQVCGSTYLLLMKNPKRKKKIETKRGKRARATRIRHPSSRRRKKKKKHHTISITQQSVHNKI